MVTCALFLLRSLTQLLWKQQFSGGLNLCRVISFTETQLYRNLFFLVLLQVEWDLYRCRTHLVQVFLPKCCSDVFLLARNFLFKWICNMLHSCNCFDCCQDYIYLLKISLLFKIWWKIHRSWNSSLFFSLLPHFSWFWTRKDIHLSPILLTLINA